MMDRKTKNLFEARAKIIKALAHPARLYIVDQLSHGEKCVCELTEMIGSDVSTVSKHLAVLKNSGIVSDEKRGTQVFYSLRVPCVLNFFSCVESVISSNARDQLFLLKE
ncbi:MAG: winged helix-turn-helix transcriptional regulator [candidate division Zixibacteria bacterium]|nr:winged helix-turn-helix transcriptional regulator [candidate division Zixibacteria bacterium]NIR64914.1 winged helix-turn-helix transcriptional regulator [candidate division Zixibacteria bacterium]NIS17757.1 winged helix-turn-helix transcriptional regulator [candidate division Zixibacteria bacterium]NIS46720.1 winged helix-turn-helix transcriptional regulator [candidate division Zixibacteria bacterium]NIT54077.1 winged helix-turn-helix transcriptional regulator [candidate division Zixibacter